MIAEVQSPLDRYWMWLREETNIRQIGEWVEITIPYLDRHNDYLQIYAKRENSGFMLTDDGYTIKDLERSGCTIDSPRRKDLFKTTLNGFGVHVSETTKALEVRASADDFALRKHSLIQAILAVNDVFYLASSTVASLFYDDDVAWLDLCDVRYTPSVRFAGKSGYDHRFDFVIPKSRIHPERILRALNRPTRDAAQTMAFAWMDTIVVRSEESRAYAILNDAEREVPQSVLDALSTYEVNPIRWSARNEVRGELAA